MGVRLDPSSSLSNCVNQSNPNFVKTFIGTLEFLIVDPCKRTARRFQQIRRGCDQLSVGICCVVSFLQRPACGYGIETGASEVGVDVVESNADCTFEAQS